MPCSRYQIVHLSRPFHAYSCTRLPVRAHKRTVYVGTCWTIGSATDTHFQWYQI